MTEKVAKKSHTKKEAAPKAEVARTEKAPPKHESKKSATPFEFIHEAMFEIDVPAGLFVSRAVGEAVQPGDVLADVSPQAGEEAVPYVGHVKVKVGETVHEGGVLAKKGVVRKRLTKSPVDGVVTDIAADLITIDVTQAQVSTLTPKAPVYARSHARVAAVSDTSCVLAFNAVALNVLTLKGDSAHGVIRFISHDECKNMKKLPADVEHSIVVTDMLAPDSYPIISSLGARVILTETMEYSIFRDIVPLSVTVGVITGFGNLPHDPSLHTYISKKEGTYCYFDASYQRLLIPEEKAPSVVPHG